MTYTRKLRRKAARAKAGPEPIAPLPWDFSTDPEPGEGVPNEPTDEGRRLGRVLATLADRAYQEREGQPLRQRCRGCALRLGTLANGCEEPLLDIIKAVIEALWGSEAAKKLEGAVRRGLEGS